uniref:Phospholipid scramblase n=1 Tax=Lotharella globosa TaxID=91324 RepID=A0A6V3SHG1_9EUKA|mmetsp:Transcript_17695/g.35703  ORF Transcript_17695/g.35703 Transcript_17695/m.35703 type:complete len:338 (+) Transcript_17695:95-1108(+)|eukprot:CAMPEP_0167792454 /NCGR_PEP_ID=MMETSP0111_2-20121227/12571_1 /TAXON_ID=91324 /ORGANISM="Lotharella globosa, Strain CCCM811" /LENGTH=337 /DNA_ID=CAMNT_0007685377 /DNA_START=43 /DNA_END=1056 /DNA_ORIENTATION=+
MVKYMRVNLRVPGWAQPGQVIEASADGKKFSVQIPAHLRPGQFFTVRVPMGGGHESKAPAVAPPEVSFNLEPNIVIGNDKYFKEVKKCQDWCDCSRLCCPYVKFSGKSEDISVKHQCCCLPCCCNFQVSNTASGSNEYKTLGTLAPAGCFDQNCTAVCCPCCYTGPKMQAKFLGSDGGIKYMLKANIECCQYCCLCLTCFSPCFRCCRFCCMDAQYTRYEQNVYGPDLNNEEVYAKIIYTDRMVCPCIPDERIQMRIEPAEGKTISKEDLILLSVFPTLISGYTCAEFCFPLCVPGGMMFAMPTPSGISQVDGANNIQFEHMNIKEALANRKQDDMY